MATPVRRRGFRARISARLTALAGVSFCVLFAPPSHANIGTDYGFSSREGSLGGTAATGPERSTAAYTNPSALAPRRKNAGLAASVGTLFMHPSMLPIRGVVVENPTTSDQTGPRLGDVDVGYRDTLGQIVGLSVPLLEGSPEDGDWSMGAGLAFFVPMESIGTYDTGEAYIPEYVLYRMRTQRPQFNFGVGIAPPGRWRFGVGMQIGYTVKSEVTSFLATSGNRISNLRLSSSIKPKASPTLGATYEGERWRGGLVVRFPLSQPTDVTVDTSVEALSGFAAPDFFFTVNSMLLYDPLTVELGAQLELIPAGKTFVQIDYQRWSAFQAPGAEVQGDPSQGVALSPATLPASDFRDLWVPRIGQEWAIAPTATLRLGYAYHAGIVGALPSDSGNILDPPKHMFNAGIGWRFDQLWGVPVPWTLDFQVSYHALRSVEITKDDPAAIGAPGYTAGGKVFGGGLTLSLGI